MDATQLKTYATVRTQRNTRISPTTRWCARNHHQGEHRNLPCSLLHPESRLRQTLAPAPAVELDQSIHGEALKPLSAAVPNRSIPPAHARQLLGHHSPLTKSPRALPQKSAAVGPRTTRTPPSNANGQTCNPNRLDLLEYYHEITQATAFD
uniref:Uncharacterized protein n=1 Tax=Triticum urartu TaxID=4572 RepID=A0A8R7PWH5_TRIUA